MSNFGPEDANREALQRLVALVTRLLRPEKALTAAGEGLEFTESRPLGGTWALGALWHRLGIDAAMRRLLAGHLDDSAERVLFAWRAARLLARMTSCRDDKKARQRGRCADNAADRDDDLDTYVKEVVDSLPPLTGEQRDLLALIFRSRHRKN